MKVWVTKYAISGQGFIPIVDAEIDQKDSTAWVEGNKGDGEYPYLLFKNNWHTTPEAAIASAEEMRTKKIASLKKQVANLEAMTFSAEDVLPTASLRGQRSRYDRRIDCRRVPASMEEEMKSKFVRLPEGGAIKVSEIRAVRVFVGSYGTSNTITLAPRVGIDYSMTGERGQSHSVSHFGSDDDARSFADSVLATIDDNEMKSKFVRLPDGSSARSDKIESIIIRDSDTSCTGQPMVCVAFSLGGDSVDALHFGCETAEEARKLAEKITADVEEAEAEQ